MSSLGVQATACLAAQMKNVKKDSRKMVVYLELERVEDAVLVVSSRGSRQGVRVSFSRDTLDLVKTSLTENNLRFVSGDQTLF